MMEEGICCSAHCLKLTTVARRCLAIVLAGEGVDVHLHAAQTKTQHFWLNVWANSYLEKLHHC